jgi:hypothetical protein
VRGSRDYRANDQPTADDEQSRPDFAWFPGPLEISRSDGGHEHDKPGG